MLFLLPRILVSDRTQVAKNGKGREIRAGKLYFKPEIQEKLPLKKYSKNDFNAFIENQEDNPKLGDLLQKSFSGMTPGVIDTILESAGIEKQVKIKSLSQDQIHKLYDTFLNAIEMIDNKTLFPEACLVLSC